ncbi:MAG: nickel-dependent hydrogenase large subunit [Acidihalobacter sp.]|uniref:nickel-dependent hydrogenase large subunit n=1 Tax=Acidihalobacter sp. TaxID=1872108 RepID=UPI00307D48AE
MSRLVMGPFNRVEGDLEVQIETADGRVSSAWVNSPLYRGFEQILLGKAPEDALVYAPRVCGVCSISQSVAAAHALADAYGAETPPNGVHAINLIHANENLVDHLTHFYLFFMPDFAREEYAARPWHETVAQRFRAVHGSAAAEFLQARAEFMHLMGLLAGKWPHSLAIQPGGCTRAVTPRERLHLGNIVGSFRRFLEKRVFGSPLEEIAALDDIAALRRWQETHAPSRSDFACFLELADDTGLASLGRAADRFMSYGSYRGPEGATHFARGVWHDGRHSRLDIDGITEDVSHSWMAGETEPPARGLTQPDPERQDAYSWCKAPRLHGGTVEVGALARQVVDGQPLIRELVTESGGNVRNRVIARLLETARVTLAMVAWIDALRPGEPFHVPTRSLAECAGVGLTEAARGSLGHWLTIEDGRIRNYQIISPTTWNFSPRDANGRPGALEQALENTPIDDDGANQPIAVQHIVRSFDPCMVCTVH